jgi:class 3 adenylate cyclase/tetratricopeptide (TPR) repeat protein
MMQTCPACGHENRETAKFCEACAVALQRVCAGCGSTLRPTANFCDECGQSATGSAAHPSPASYTPKHLADKILTSRAALEGERKQVTVLFADVKGSMELAEQVDPEEWHRIMDRFFQILTDGVHRFEGTVNQYTGDGIMALFGAPIAHEDHAQRACYAALHLREELRAYAAELKRTRGLSFAVRMGLNSGEVIVGSIGDDLRMDYTAQGHTVGLAQRMEQLADAGTAYLSEHTAKLVQGFFVLRELGAFTVKGVRDALHVFELQGTGAFRTRLDAARTRGLSRFVGRDDEMRALDAALTRAVEGHGQVVGVVADPGTGKSRLCFEFTQRCRARGLAVFEAHAVAHGKRIALLPILELFRAFYGVTSQDNDLAAREKIAGRMLLLDDNLRDTLPLVFDFLGVPDPTRPVPAMDPEARQRQLFAIVKRVVQARSRREPAVTLIEDLHWIDGSSAAVLEVLVEATAATRSLLLVNFRPEYHAAWMQQSSYQQTPLLPLGPEAIQALLDDLLGHDASVTGLAAAVHARTAGNPFFAEEVVQALIEAGTLQGTKGAYRLVAPVATLAVPTTVQTVLAARIDRLGEREKEVLQTAAVIGKEFNEPVLRQVVGAVRQPPIPDADLAAALAALKRAEFIYETALYPVAEYAFKHPLTQEVAYGSQLQERRRATHAAVARALEAASGARGDEQAALLAHHWEAAGEALLAAHWHSRAAAWAEMRDIAQEHRHWHAVRALVATLPESDETLRLAVAAHVQLVNLGWRLGTSDEETTTLFAAGCELAERAGDVRSLALLWSNYSLARWNCDESLRCHDEAVRLAAQTGDVALEAVVGCNLMPRTFAGRLRETLERADALMALTGSDPRFGVEIMHFSPYVWLRTLSGYVLHWIGRASEGRRDFEEALELATKWGLGLNQQLAHTYLALAWAETGAADAALRHARQAVDLAERIGGHGFRAFAYHALGAAHLCGAEWDEAVSALEQERTIAHEHQFVGLLSASLLAQARLARGEIDAARALALEAVDNDRRVGARLNECRAQLVLAQVLLHSDGVTARSAVEAALARAAALIEETGAVLYAPQLHVRRAELAQTLGDEAQRIQELREAHRLFTELGAAGHAERISRQLAAVGTQPEER